MAEPTLPTIITPLADLKSDAYEIKYLNGGNIESLYCTNFVQLNGFCIMEGIKKAVCAESSICRERFININYREGDPKRSSSYSAPVFGIEYGTAGSSTRGIWYASNHKSKVIKESRFHESTSYEKDEVPLWFHRTKKEAQEKVDTRQKALNLETRKKNKELLEEAKGYYRMYLAEKAWYDLGFLSRIFSNKDKFIEIWKKDHTAIDYSFVEKEVEKYNINIEK